MEDLHAVLARIAAAAAATKPGAQLSGRTILRSGKLSVGTHSVRIDAVDTAYLGSRGWVDITFGTPQEATHRERVWVLARDKQSLGYGLRMILEGLFGSPEPWLVALGINQDQAFHLLRGMRADVEIGYGPGYIIEQTPDGYQAVVNTHVVCTGADMTTTKTAAEAAGHQRAWLRLKGVTSVSQQQNLEALDNAITALRDLTDATPIDLGAYRR